MNQENCGFSGVPTCFFRCRPPPSEHFTLARHPDIETAVKRVLSLDVVTIGPKQITDNQARACFLTGEAQDFLFRQRPDSTLDRYPLPGDTCPARENLG